jgi:hypothetical protein
MSHSLSTVPTESAPVGGLDAILIGGVFAMMYVSFFLLQHDSKFIESLWGIVSVQILTFFTQKSNDGALFKLKVSIRLGGSYRL